MRVAVLSHNTIRKDARIIKEIQTLEDDFPGLMAFGLKQRGEIDDPGSYPFKTPVVLSMRRISMGAAQAVLDGWPRFMSYRRMHWLSIGLLFAAVVTSFGTVFNGIPVLLPLVLMVAGAMLFQFSGRSHRKPEWVLSPKTGESVCITQARAALFKSSYHLIKAVRDEASRGGPFQIIHAHDLAGLEAGVRIKKELGGTLIWDAHEIYEDLANPDPVSSANARRAIKEAAPLVDHFITINEGLAAHYRRHHPDLPEAIIVMNATVRGQPPQDDGRLRQALGADSKQKILLFQGGLSMHRGLPKLVQAARDFPADWILALMGEGHLEDELRAIAQDVNAAAGQGRVRFIPSVPQAELIFWTAGATLGAIPYENVAGNHWFCTPNKLWEYPAAGVPFIAPRLYEILRIVDEYETGFLFPAEFDSPTISDLVQTIGDGALAEKRANIERFLKEMSWETFAPRLTGLYRMIAADIVHAEKLAAKQSINPTQAMNVPGRMHGGETLLVQDR